MNDELKIVFLGTGAAIPTLRRGLPSLAIIKDNRTFLCDCGEGTQLRIMQAGLHPSKISHIFISHLHGDHIFGLPGFLSTQQMMGRMNPLTLFGPKGLKKFIEKVRNISEFTLDFSLRIVELEPERQKFQVDDFVVKTSLLEHRSLCYGYGFFERPRPGKFNVEKAKMFDIPPGPQRAALKQGNAIFVHGRKIRPDDVLAPPVPGRVIAYCSDTRPCSSAVELAKDCDVLVHDSTFAEHHKDKAHESFHSTAEQAAKVAARANAKKLILWHISSRYDEDDERELLAQARQVFPESYLSRDFAEIKIERPEHI